MSKHVPAYPPAFRAEAIRLARSSGESHAQIARKLGLTTETLRIWLKQADVDEGKRLAAYQLEQIGWAHARSGGRMVSR